MVMVLDARPERFITGAAGADLQAVDEAGGNEPVHLVRHRDVHAERIQRTEIGAPAVASRRTSATTRAGPPSRAGHRWPLDRSLPAMLIGTPSIRRSPGCKRGHRNPIRCVSGLRSLGGLLLCVGAGFLRQHEIIVVIS
jgi:hypothetical protein